MLVNLVEVNGNRRTYSLREDLTASSISVVDDSSHFVRGGVGFDYQKRDLALSRPTRFSRPWLTNLELSLYAGTLFLAIFLLYLGVILQSRHELLGDHIDLFVFGSAVNKTNHEMAQAWGQRTWFLRAS